MAPSSAGYSGTPLPKKLGIRPGDDVVFVHAPPDLPQAIGSLPDGVRVKQVARGPLDVAVLFVTRRADLERRLGRLQDVVVTAGGLWVAWPKRASGVATDMTEDVVREVGLPTGWVDNKVCAIDSTWSGLRLVRRREHR